PCGRDAATNVWDAQAAFPVLEHVTADDRNLGVDDGQRLRRRLLLGRRIERRDEQPDAFMHLRSRQADAVILEHRFAHVVDELLDDWIHDFGAVERARLGAENRMAHARHLEDRHNPRIILTVWALSIPTTNHTASG